MCYKSPLAFFLLHCCIFTTPTFFGSNSQSLLAWKLSLFTGAGSTTGGGRQVRFTPAFAILTGNLNRPLNTTLRPPVGGVTARPPATLTTIRPAVGAVTTRPAAVVATQRPVGVGIGVGVNQQQILMYPGGQFYPGYIPQQGLPYPYPGLVGYPPGLYGQGPGVGAGLYGQGPGVGAGLYGQGPGVGAGLYGQVPGVGAGLYGQVPGVGAGLYGQVPGVGAGLYGQGPGVGYPIGFPGGQLPHLVGQKFPHPVLIPPRRPILTIGK